MFCKRSKGQCVLGLTVGDAEKDLEQAERLGSGSGLWALGSKLGLFVPTVPSPSYCVCVQLPITPHILFLPVLTNLGTRRNIWSWHMLHGSYFPGSCYFQPILCSSPSTCLGLFHCTWPVHRIWHVTLGLPCVCTFNWFARGPGHNLGRESTVLQYSWLRL